MSEKLARTLVVKTATSDPPGGSPDLHAGWGYNSTGSCARKAARSVALTRGVAIRFFATQLLRVAAAFPLGDELRPRAIEPLCANIPNEDQRHSVSAVVTHLEIAPERADG